MFLYFLPTYSSLPYRNVANNLFSGPIPDKLLSIPNFKSDGNSFNTTTGAAPLAPPGPPSTTTPTGSGTPFFPSPKQTPGKQPPGKQAPPQASGPSSQGSKSSTTSKSWTAKKKVWVSIASVFGFILLALVCLLFSPRRFRRKRTQGLIPKRHEIAPYTGRENLIDNGTFSQPPNQVDKGILIMFTLLVLIYCHGFCWRWQFQPIYL